MTEQPVFRETVEVKLPDGLHLRPISMIAEVARDSKSKVRMIKEQTTVDAASVLDVMTLNIQCGTILEFEVSGPDAEKSLAKIMQLFATDFEDPVEDAKVETDAVDR